MSENNLGNYLKVNFALIQHHGWGGEYIDALVPWERNLYVDWLNEYLKKLREEREARAMGGR